MFGTKTTKIEFFLMWGLSGIRKLPFSPLYIYIGSAIIKSLLTEVDGISIYMV